MHPRRSAGQTWLLEQYSQHAHKCMPKVLRTDMIRRFGRTQGRGRA